jgi:WD40 repeat protein
MVVSGDNDKVVKVWELTGEASAECVATLEGRTNWVMGVAVGPDFVASQAYDDSELIVWRAA